MSTNRNIPTAQYRWRQSYWSRLLCALLLWMVSVPMLAQKDIITFTGGAADPNNPDIYVIDAGPDDVIVDPEGGNSKVRIRLSRPLGASATHEASILINNLNQPWDEGTTVTFARGETEKTVEIETYTYAFESYNGNAPAVFSVLSTNYAKAAYDVVIYNINHTATQPTPACDFGTPLEMLQALDLKEREIYGFRWGKYLLFAFKFSEDYEEAEAYMKISADSASSLNALTK